MTEERFRHIKIITIELTIDQSDFIPGDQNSNGVAREFWVKPKAIARIVTEVDEAQTIEQAAFEAIRELGGFLSTTAVELCQAHKVHWAALAPDPTWDSNQVKTFSYYDPTNGAGQVSSIEGAENGPSW